MTVNNGGMSTEDRQQPPARASEPNCGYSDSDGVDIDSDSDEDNDGDEDEDSDEDYVDENEDEDNDNEYDPIPPPTATSPVLEALAATYNLQTHRWRLSTGRDVESILYENCRLMDPPTFAASLAPSFTVDLQDPIVHGWFTKTERNEIRQSVPLMPVCAPSILTMFKSLRRFERCKTPAEVREVLATTSPLDPGETYTPERDFLCMWSDLVIRNLYLSHYTSLWMRTDIE